MILFQQPYLTIEYDAAIKCLIQSWKGFAKSEQFREGIEKSVELFKQQDLVIDKIISNTKDSGIVKKEDTDFAANHATPIMIQYGLKYMAFIIPTSAFAQLSVDNYKSQTNEIIQVRYFDELQKAKEWMTSIK